MCFIIRNLTCSLSYVLIVAILCFRQGIARTLVKAALKALARERGQKYKELKKIEIQERRRVHDDITVVVLFLDSRLISSSSSSRRRPTVSERTYALDINRAGTSGTAGVDNDDLE